GGAPLPSASAAATKPWRTASARRPSAGELTGRIRAMCGFTSTGMASRACAFRSPLAAGNSRNGRTSVVRESPVDGSISSAGSTARGVAPEGPGLMVVPTGGSAENAGETARARMKRKEASKRDIGAEPAESLAPGLYVVATPIGYLGDI